MAKTSPMNKTATSKLSGAQSKVDDGTKEEEKQDGVVDQEKPPGGEATENKEDEEEPIVEEDDPELSNPNLIIDDVDMTAGSQLTFTFEEGLIVQIQPNGDVL